MEAVKSQEQTMDVKKDANDINIAITRRKKLKCYRALAGDRWLAGVRNWHTAAVLKPNKEVGLTILDHLSPQLVHFTLN